MKRVYTLIVKGVRRQNINSGDLTISIDTVRCSTTIIYAFLNGVDSVFPAGTIDEAKRLAKATPNSFLAGERGGVKVQDFDYNNSPTELKSANVNGKRMIISTSNGTKLIKLGLERSRVVLIGALINAKACADLAYKLSSESRCDVKMLIPWMRGGVAIEDLYTAGVISKYLLEKGFEPAFDTVRVGFMLSNISYDDMAREIRSSWSARRISEIGYGFDVELCLALNECDVVPFSSGKRLIISE
jgi:2-phosphosulfolactate phosphatase